MPEIGMSAVNSAARLQVINMTGPVVDRLRSHLKLKFVGNTGWLMIRTMSTPTLRKITMDLEGCTSPARLEAASGCGSATCPTRRQMLCGVDILAS
jgi:hypothetical protein